MKKSSKIIFIIIMILVVVLLGIGIYLVIENKKEYDNKIGELENQIVELKEKNEDVQENTNSKNIASQNNINDSNKDTNNTINNSNNNKVTNSTTSESNTRSNTLNDNKSNNNENTINNVNKENALYVYSSGDNAAAHGNPELLYIYEMNDNVIKFQYHAPWNSEDIQGTANKTESNLYVYEKGNKKVELLLNSMGENSIKVTEYENGSLSSFKNLWK